jgi:hypothetical protein
MYCPGCGSQLHDNNKFCTRCGVEASQSEQLLGLVAKCHNGYLSTVTGLGLVIISLLIIIASLMLGAELAAISSLIFLGWAIPAIAQGVGRWQSAKNEIRSLLEVGSRARGELPQGIAASVTEETTASLNRPV